MDSVLSSLTATLQSLILTNNSTGNANNNNSSYNLQSTNQLNYPLSSSSLSVQPSQTDNNAVTVPNLNDLFPDWLPFINEPFRSDEAEKFFSHEILRQGLQIQQSSMITLIEAFKNRIVKVVVAQLLEMYRDVPEEFWERYSSVEIEDENENEGRKDFVDEKKKKQEWENEKGKDVTDEPEEMHSENDDFSRKLIDFSLFPFSLFSNNSFIETDSDLQSSSGNHSSTNSKGKRRNSLAFLTALVHQNTRKTKIFPLNSSFSQLNQQIISKFSSELFSFIYFNIISIYLSALSNILTIYPSTQLFDFAENVFGLIEDKRFISILYGDFNDLFCKLYKNRRLAITDRRRQLLQQTRSQNDEKKENILDYDDWHPSAEELNEILLSHFKKREKKRINWIVPVCIVGITAILMFKYGKLWNWKKDS